MGEQYIEAWRRVWREGLAPQLSAEALEALADAVVDGDPRLIQGATTEPVPLQCMLDRPVEGCCAVAYAVWKGEGLATVGEVLERFERVCLEANLVCGEPDAVRWFLNTFDEWSREQLLNDFLPEVERAIAGRGREFARRGQVAA